MLKNSFRGKARRVLAPLFSNPTFRRKAIFELKSYYYNELEFSLQLGWGLQCPIFHPSGQFSFSEIFFQGEYDQLFQKVPLPDRWLDLGCHYGFFSLYVAWLRAKEGRSIPFHALMVDADSRVEPGIRKLINMNDWGKQAAFLHGAIAEGNGIVHFQQQEVMSSSLSNLLDKHSSLSPEGVPIITQQMILQTIPPPYDLIKVDVEGGEYDFLQSYPQVLEASKYMVVEWHSWHRGGGGADQIREIAQSLGFVFVQVIQEPKSCGPNKLDQVGVFLFERRAPLQG